MANDPVWVRDDVDAILTGLFDIRVLVTTLVELIEGEDEGQEEKDT